MMVLKNITYLTKMSMYSLKNNNCPLDIQLKVRIALVIMVWIS